MTTASAKVLDNPAEAFETLCSTLLQFGKEEQYESPVGCLKPSDVSSAIADFREAAGWSDHEFPPPIQELVMMTHETARLHLRIGVVFDKLCDAREYFE